MEHKGKSIRPFIGSKEFTVSRNFYRDLGFEEKVLFPNMSYFKSDGLGFYLQDAYIKEWVDNSMVFMEVDNIERFWKELLKLNLPLKYENVRLTPIQYFDWGNECYLHDPSGILWHFGEFADSVKNRSLA